MVPSSMRCRPRVCLLLAVLILVPFLALGIHASNLYLRFKDLPSHWQQNIALHYSPERLRPYVRPLIEAPDPGGPPPFFPDVFNAKWAGSWPLPSLSPPTYAHAPNPSGERTLTSPAFLMLHVFSTSKRKSRLRRDLIREYNLKQTVPKAYQHLVEIKFVLGLPETLSEEEKESEDGKALIKEYEEEESQIQDEIAKYGDIIRLQKLKGGENMNNGKSMEWMRWVGRPGGREAQWVLKCDDDTFPILPNLLAFLAKHDPSKPTYLGSSIGHYTGFQFYFEGMMYGFSWGVIKTMANANLPESFIQDWMHEDGRLGEIMCNLPSIPLCSGAPTRRDLLSRAQLAPETTPTQCVTEQIPFDTPPPSGWGGTPLSPDPRSGLVRLDFGRRLGNWESWAIPKKADSVGWHNLKSDSDYVAAYYRAHQLLERAGRKYMWSPPQEFAAFADD